MSVSTSPYVEFRAEATAAGIAPEIVSALSDGYRDSHEHGWSGAALEWCGDPDLLIARALEAPERIAAVCSYFFATDGGNYHEGLKYLDRSTRELAEQILAEGWGFDAGTAADADEAATSFVVKADASQHPLKYLQGPRSPQDVKKLGYRFTPNESEAWPFPTRKQAAAKARALDKHMGWGLGIAKVFPSTVRSCEP